MKKILFAAAAVALTLTSCLKENGIDRDYQRVQQGIQIADQSRMQNIISMQPADMAVRLAMLLAEAEKQKDPDTGETPELTKIKVNGKNVFEQLFYYSNATVEKQDNGDYKMTFDPQGFDAYYKSKGKMTVKTNGLLLAQTDGSADNSWTVTLDPGFQVLVLNNMGGYQPADVAARGIKLYRNAEGYKITIDGVAAGSSESEVRSNWSGEFTLTAPAGGEELAYSDCAGKMYGFSGNASGKSLFTFDGTTPVGFSYKVEDGHYENFQQVLDGTEKCVLMDSNTNFAAPNVEVEWVLSEDGKKITQHVRYNGYEYSKTYSR